MYLFQRIEEASLKKMDVRRVIGDFLLENRDEIPKLKMDEIASRTHTSKATLVRFAKYFDYSGWTEFMYAFSHEIAHFEENTFEIDSNLPFNKASDTLEIIEKIANLRIQTIKETASLMLVDEVTKAATIINEADNIIIYGRSPNSYLGALFKRNLNAIHKRAFMADADESGLISSSLTQKDCAVILSYPGNNEDIYPMKNIKQLVKNGVPIISITSGGQNFLRDYSAVTLTILSREKLYSKISNFSTEESTLFILNILYSKIFSLNFEQNMETKIKNSRHLENSRQTTFKDMSEDF